MTVPASARVWLGTIGLAIAATAPGEGLPSGGPDHDDSHVYRPPHAEGDTGYSNAPHLHFGVYRTAADGRDVSIPVQFSFRGRFIGQLRAGRRYVNRTE